MVAYWVLKIAGCQASDVEGIPKPFEPLRVVSYDNLILCPR